MKFPQTQLHNEKMHGFHDVILLDGGIHTKLINISTAAYPGLLTMVSF